MKRNTFKKGLLALPLSLSLAFTAVPALAANTMDTENAPTVFTTATETIITFAEGMPRYINITRISCG